MALSFQILSTNGENEDEINIDGTNNEIIEKCIEIINTNIISKRTNMNYYIQLNGHCESPFSNSNNVEHLIPNILLKFMNSNVSDIDIKIRFYSNDRSFDPFEISLYPIYTLKIKKLI